MRARRGWAAVLLAGAAGLAALGPVLWVTALPAAAATYNVSIDDKQPPDPNGVGVFNPGVKQIHVNDRILWTNNASTKHTVTSDPGSVTFDSGDLARGGTFEFRFTTAGTYTYHCTRHPKMVARIEVIDPNTTTTTAAPTTTTAPPTTTTTAPATTTTAPPPTTTTAAPRPAAAPGPQPAPPVANSAAAPPPPSSSTTTSGPSTTTTTTVPPTTPTSAPPVLAGGEEGTAPASSTAPPTTAAQKPPGTGDKMPTAAGPPASPGGKLDVTAVALVSALVAVGMFAVWTLIRIRPGRI